MAFSDNGTEKFANVEKLRERANVTYEEARQALDGEKTRQRQSQ